tara:strand:+ start:1072 stop:1440 length:369 start_codon:yes stop_codon:yes gene_type:complete
MATITKIKWEDADFKWNIAPPSEDYKPGFTASSFPFTWDDVALIEEVVEAVQEAGGSVIDGISKLEPEKKKRFIKLVCKVKGVETYSGQKTIRDDIKISVEDIELVIKEVLGIDLTVENIHV